MLKFQRSNLLQFYFDTNNSIHKLIQNKTAHTFVISAIFYFAKSMDNLHYIGRKAIKFNHAYDKLHQGPYKTTFIILNINFVTLIGNGFCPTEFSDFL